jgi:predicted GNAT superfamily acetyltransferase
VDGPAAQASTAAAAAAERAGVRLHELHDVEQMREAAALFDAVWGRHRAAGAILAPEMLVAMAHAGCQVSGAVRDGRLVGATAAIVGLDEHHAPFLHSHVTGVVPEHAGAGVGWALKQHQRAWCLARGLTTVRWTFDPLIRRNAVFNLVKLGARIDGYEEDRYGRMDDARNAGLPTDRLVARWDLTERRVALAADGRFAEPDVARLRGAGAEPALQADEGGHPLLRRTEADHLLVAVPHDVERLRSDDPPAAEAWAGAIREALGGALAGGYRVTGFARDGWYVLARDRRVEELR